MVGKPFKVPLKHFSSNEHIVITEVELKQRYYKKGFIDESLSKYFDNLKEEKCLSKDKITVNITFKQGNLYTSQLLWFSNSIGDYGDTVTSISKASNFLLMKLPTITEDFKKFAKEFDTIIKEQNYNKLQDLLEDYFVGREYILQITNKNKNYYKLIEEENVQN